MPVSRPSSSRPPALPPPSSTHPQPHHSGTHQLAMSNPQEILLAHTLSSLNSSLSVLTQLNLLSEHDAREIRGKLPLPTALNHAQPANGGWAGAGPSSSGNSWEANNGGNNNNNGGPSHPYPAPIYGQGAGGGGGAARAPPPLPGRSYPGLGEARAVWDYHGGVSTSFPCVDVLPDGCQKLEATLQGRWR